MRGASAHPLSVVRAVLFSFVSLADLGESGDRAGRSVDPVLCFPFFLAFLPSPLLYPSFYATLPSPRPRRVFFVYSPDDSLRRGCFLFVCLLVISPTYGSSPPATSLSTPSAVHRRYALCAHGHIGDLTSYLPGVWRASILFGGFFFSSRGQGGSSESEIWGSRPRSQRLCRLSTISSFFSGFFFWRGILISRCFWRDKYATPCACTRALSWLT
jgi:hypothetical protein